MEARNEVGDRHGRAYRLLKDTRGVYHAALNCDCLLGPHWHELGSFKRKADAYRSIDGDTLHVSEQRGK